MTGEIIAYVVGGAGVLFGARCYLELWRWAKQCQRARIAIANNKRVQLNAPLTEWLTWANMLDGDQRSKGRVVYRNARVSVAILRPDKDKSAKTTVKHIRNARRGRKAKVAA